MESHPALGFLPVEGDFPKALHQRSLLGRCAVESTPTQSPCPHPFEVVQLRAIKPIKGKNMQASIQLVIGGKYFLKQDQRNTTSVKIMQSNKRFLLIVVFNISHQNKILSSLFVCGKLLLIKSELLYKPNKRSFAGKCDRKYCFRDG